MKVIRNIIFQGSGFTRSEAIDRTFPKCSARDKINDMIPQLVLWETMGRLFAEYFSVYAVLGRNLNKRRSRGKTSSKLGRGGKEREDRREIRRVAKQESSRWDTKDFSLVWRPLFSSRSVDS